MRALTMKTQSLQSNKQQQGFTLIELVIVIVILGILAATAAPKFIDLQGDAKDATLQAVKASTETAMAGIYAKSLIAGVEKKAADNSVTTTGATTINTVYGYPKAANVDMKKVLDIDVDFKYVDIAAAGGVAAKVLMYPTANTAPTASGDACTVEYTEATSATVKAKVVVNTGC